MRKSRFFAFWRQTDKQTDRQTDEQMDSTDALSRSRCRERRLNKQYPAVRKTRTLLRYVRLLASVCRLFVTLVHPIQRVEFFRISLHHTAISDLYLLATIQGMTMITTEEEYELVWYAIY